MSPDTAVPVLFWVPGKSPVSAHSEELERLQKGLFNMSDWGLEQMVALSRDSVVPSFTCRSLRCAIVQKDNHKIHVMCFYYYKMVHHSIFKKCVTNFTSPLHTKFVFLSIQWSLKELHKWCLLIKTKEEKRRLRREGPSRPVFCIKTVLCGSIPSHWGGDKDCKDCKNMGLEINHAL